MADRKRSRLVVGAAAMFVVLIFVRTPAQGADSIFTSLCRFETCGIRRANLDGTNESPVVGSAAALAIDALHGKVYYAGHLFSGFPGTIRRCSFDGTAEEPVISGLSIASAIAVDGSGGKVYFTEFQGLDGYRIGRANLDGSAQETLVTAPQSFGDVDVDPGGGKIYFTQGTYVRRANVDGSFAQTLFSDPSELGGIAVHPAGKLYVTSPSRILRANLDGSDVEAIVTTDDLPGAVFGIAIDRGRNQIYFTTLREGIINSGVWRANADGSGLVNLTVSDSSVDQYLGIDLDVPGNAIAVNVPATSTWGLWLLVALLLATSATVLARQRARQGTFS